MEINKQGLKIKNEKKAPLTIPEEFTKLLKKHRKENIQFQQLTPSHQRRMCRLLWMQKRKKQSSGDLKRCSKICVKWPRLLADWTIFQPI
jgi:uncharacterized protein YdeI (YjbR/CyaY-like superfamily)